MMGRGSVRARAALPLRLAQPTIATEHPRRRTILATYQRLVERWENAARHVREGRIPRHRGSRGALPSDLEMLGVLYERAVAALGMSLERARASADMTALMLDLADERAFRENARLGQLAVAERIRQEVEAPRVPQMSASRNYALRMAMAKAALAAQLFGATADEIERLLHLF